MPLICCAVLPVLALSSSPLLFRPVGHNIKSSAASLFTTASGGRIIACRLLKQTTPIQASRFPTALQTKHTHVLALCIWRWPSSVFTHHINLRLWGAAVRGKGRRCGREVKLWCVRRKVWYVYVYLCVRERHKQTHKIKTREETSRQTERYIDTHIQTETQ